MAHRQTPVIASPPHQRWSEAFRTCDHDWGNRSPVYSLRADLMESTWPTSHLPCDSVAPLFGFAGVCVLQDVGSALGRSLASALLADLGRHPRGRRSRVGGRFSV